MADEVPASDVLCQAMEYLSKLGSNLRSRSENLKEKRISKDKLRNSHAVHKAASKVLLICELSKRSLDNVETGVRKVLALLDEATAGSSSVGGKTSTDKGSCSANPDVYYFEYKSRKLRISTKVPVKHYMSVKVHAKQMSPPMLEKYPVYHNCKLYRSRKKALEQQISKENTEQHSKRKISSDQTDTENRVIKPCNVPFDKMGTEDVSHEEFSRLNNEEAVVDILDDSKSNGDKLNPDSEDIISTEKEKTKETSAEDGSNSEENDNMKTQIVLDSHSTSSRKQSTDSRQIEKCKKPEQNRLDSNYSNEAKEDSGSVEKSYDNDIKESVSVLPKHHHHRTKENIKKSKKYKHIVIPEDSSDDDEIKVPKNLETEECDVSADNKSDHTDKNPCEHEPKKRKLVEEHDESVEMVDSNDEEKEIKAKNENKNKGDVESEEDSKPLIRCVNISKLLKPDILDKKSHKKINVESEINIIRNKKKEVNTAKRTGETLGATVKETKKINEEYWVQKREEVKSFQSKEFTIAIARLPKLSVKFLNLHSLMKITHNGVIICESVKGDGIISNKSVEDITQVKNALLNDSDSDNETLSSVVVEAKRVKNHFLDDSETDNNTENNNSQLVDKRQNDPETKDIQSDSVKDKVQSRPISPVPNNDKVSTEADISPTKVKNALLTESDSDMNEGQGEKSRKNVHSNERNNDPDNIKDALLNDSESDKDNAHGSKQGDEDEPFSNKDLEELKKHVSDILKSSLLKDSDSEQNESKDKGHDSPKDNDGEIKNHNDESKNAHQQQCDGAGKCKEDAPNVINPGGTDNDDSSKPSPSKDPDRVKSALLNDSDSMSASEENHKKEKKLRVSKHAKESVNAKKKLLTYSSSSDAENEHSESSSGKHSSKKRKRLKKKPRHSSSSSSSQESMISHPKKKVKLGSKSPEHNDSQSNTDAENVDKAACINDASQEQTDGTDQTSNSSGRKMVRSKAKPSGSSGQSSDTQEASDKDIDGLTNLNSLNKARRRHDSTSTTATNNTQSTNSTARKKSAKASAIGEDLLKAECSSDSVTDDQNNDNSDIDDLPPLPISELNGGSIDHLAKDDLLDDTDSSGSQDKNKTEDNQTVDESEEESNVKSKRRKANAISSDSEAGSSRRKARVKLSDFEDSGDDSSEPSKKSKRKKKGTDSDASATSSDAGKKKRRRIKQLDSDASGSDTETEGRNKHGRKNIRKVMGKNQLEEATKKAAREEKERIARIAERQKLYNNLEFDESGKPDEVVLEKVVLDFDPETKEPLIEVDRGLVKKLKPHQANGIKFMWDACFESVKRIKKDRGSGCILAHCMGLGKTLQVISLTHTLLTHSSLTGVSRVLVVCPLSTVLNWVNEFRMWLKHAENDFDVDVYELSRYKQNSERAFQLQQWLDGGGVCVLGYEMFRNLSSDNNKKFKKKMLKSFQESLVDPGPDLVVCDEGHLLKNEKTSLSQAMNRVKTRRRIVLTGTPLQNNLKEYYCMVQFVKPNLLGKYNEYLNRFVNPITNGQYTDSTEHDIRVMKRRSHVLHKMLDGAVQRRDYGVLAPFLPPKHEYVLFITLTDVQIKLYQHYLDNYSRRPLPGKSSGFLFPDFQSLQRIWTHPLVLKYNSERYEIMQQKKREREEEDDSEGSLADFINDDSTPDESSTEESTDDSSDMSDDSRKKIKKKKATKKGKGKDTKVTPRRGTRANPVEIEEDVHEGEEVVEVKNENPTEWWIKLVTDDDELEDLRNSHKLVLLFDILRQCDTIGDKLLVFSQSLYSLDLIEHFLGKVDEATQEGRKDEKLGGHVGSWSPGVDYFRLDGSTSCENRSIWCKNFNREDNPRARLFLISTRAGGLGINLVAANRVVIFDVSWNPSHDVQSIFRVYRFGQKKPCYVYRFLAMGTMEEKIYERQVTKQAISKRVIDEQQIDRHYAENDLAELYKFEPQPPTPRPLPTLPKDRLFAEMLREHEAQIYKYHEHDSLLENKEEETLSEEERKAAWEDFENEKNKPPPAPFPSAWPMHNGMVLAQQQQQLAFAALTAMLRKDMPNINDNQIRDMLPMIYNSNPGLMQKMSEIYKYAQPGMMNPAMMNPVMNPGGGGGMGGTSGLQYEPPWQRQHQQQQQLRLQQLMQQQNQMGAKFYAGGLGSRDPVAMALQQQRAREIMMGGAGRPRGRPPLQPRAPPAHAPDVVNLDSD